MAGMQIFEECRQFYQSLLSLAEKLRFWTSIFRLMVIYFFCHWCIGWLNLFGDWGNHALMVLNCTWLALDALIIAFQLSTYVRFRRRYFHCLQACRHLKLIAEAGYLSESAMDHHLEQASAAICNL